MAEITNLSRIVDGVTRNIKLKNTTLGVQSVKFYLNDSDSSGVELTKAILSSLIGGGDASSLHNHDGRYFTETELSSATASSGSDLIGDDNTYSNFTPAAATVKGAFSGIDAAIGALQNATVFTDSAFRIKDEAKPTAELAFNADAITAGTTRFIIMPDANVNLGALTNSNIATGADIARSKLAAGAAYRVVVNNATGIMSDAAAITADRALISDANGIPTHSLVTATELGYVAGVTSGIQSQINSKAADSIVIKKDGSVAFTGPQSMGGNQLTSVAAGTLNTDAVNKGQMDAADALKVSKAGDTMTGFLTLHADPEQALHAVTKQYVDGIAAGFDAHEAVHLATTEPLPACTPTGTKAGKILTGNSNGALSVDGHTVVLGDRILVKNQVAAVDNGVYEVTVAGDGSNPFVLTRAVDMDGASPSTEVSGGDAVYVTEGVTNGGTSWAVLKPGGGFIDVDVDAFDWTQISGVADVEAGAGLSKTGSVLNVNVDGSSIGITGGDALEVKDLGISTAKIAAGAVTADKLATSVAGAGLVGGGGTALAVNVDDSTLAITTDVVHVKAGGITGTELNASVAGAGLSLTGGALVVNAGNGLEVAGDSVGLAASAAGDGLSLSSGILSVNVDNATVELNADALRLKAGGIDNTHISASAGIATSKLADGTTIAEAVTFFNSTNITAANANTLIQSGNADTLHKHKQVVTSFTNNTGSTLLAGTVVIASQSVAGEIAKANSDAIATCEGVVGVVLADIANGTSGYVVIAGEVDVLSVTGGLDLGKRVYVAGGADAGKTTKTAPTAVDTVVHLVGTCVGTNRVVLNFNLVAVNE